MLTIFFVSKDKVGVCQQIWVYLFQCEAIVMSELAIYRVGKLIAFPCCITFKILAAEWHDQYG